MQACGVYGGGDSANVDDNVRMALHVVLERLSPAERTTFVLHDVFRYPFEAIAEIVGRTPAACRQLASRARHTISSDVGSPSRFHVESAEERRVTEQFIAACVCRADCLPSRPQRFGGRYSGPGSFAAVADELIARLRRAGSAPNYATE
jgi:Sigma-70, region 4